MKKTARALMGCIALMSGLAGCYISTNDIKSDFYQQSETYVETMEAEPCSLP